ncbi:MarC family protein [Rubritalea tangerina]|uniref:UPF0056 membrane protein n=1 Tax=Rubritalea tangerina TaxID=430798 RepID=A0ABW4ZEU4_9BACT
MDILGLIVMLVIVVDPFGNIPMFYAVLSGTPEDRHRKIMLRELLFALLIMMFFLFLGNHMLEFLDLKTSTLRVSGGVVLFLIAMGMLFPAKSVLKEVETEEPFIVPLAVPLMAGPSVLTLIMLLAAKHQDEMGQVTLAVFLAWLTVAVIMLASPFFMKVLGRKGMRAIERLMGMLLVMISVQMILDGVAAFMGMQTG